MGFFGEPVESKEYKRQIADQKKTIERLSKEIKELELKKQMDEREIKQLVKIKLENSELEYQKKTIELQGDFNRKEMDLQSDYHNKQLKDLDIARKEMKEVYSAIMKRLPNVNLEITKDI